VGDCSEADVYRLIFQVTKERFGTIDAVVANASIGMYGSMLDETAFAVGVGSTASDPALANYLRPEDIAFQIVSILRQLRTVWTHIWMLWPMSQQS
jgi:hypothetical protein